MGKNWSRGMQFVPRRTCEVCEREFYAPPVLIRRGGGRFCSKPCKGVAMSRGVVWGGRCRGKAGARDDLGDVVFRSSWEADWARQLEFLRAHGMVRKWEYEADSFLLPFKSKDRRYIPDFKVTWEPGFVVEYHEVKGVRDSRWRSAQIGMRRFHPDVRLRVIDISCLRALHAMKWAIPHLEADLGSPRPRQRELITPELHHAIPPLTTLLMGDAA